MKKTVSALLVLVFACAPVRADTLPAAVLDKEYQSCIKQATPATAAAINSYCLCIRNKMAAWDENTYIRVAEDIQKSGSSSPLLQQLAKECYPPGR